MKKLCVGIAAIAMAGSAWAEANKITAVELMPPAGGKQVLQFQLQKTVSAPAAFTINNPPKISLDFLETENGLGRNSLSFNQNGLRSLNVVEAKGRTRVVLNLEKMLAYETKVEGNKLLLTLAAQDSAADNGSTTPPTFASNAPAAAAKDSVRDIDFRRGKNGEGRIIVDLTSANAGVDIRQQGRQLLVDIFKTNLPASLARRMDVADFATPVQKVDAFAQGDNVRLAVEPKGNWEYSAYQTDNRLIVEVKPVSEPSKEDAIKPIYKGDKLSLNFQNVEVRTVLQVIAEFTGKNIVSSDSVSGTLTLRLKDVPWDQALDIILQARGLDKRENGNVMWIAPRDELNAKEGELLKSKQQTLELESTRTESFQLKYQRAEDMAKLLTTDKQSLLSKRGSAVFDQKTNMLLVNDVPSKLEEVRALINKIDIATRQVLIEARIVEAEDTWGKTLGARLSLVKSTGNFTTTGSMMDDANLHPASGNPSTEYYANNNVNMPAVSIQGALANPASIFASVGNSFIGGVLGLELSALEADGKGKIVSSPRIMTADQTEATIRYGEELPYRTVSSNGTTVTFKEALLKLKVTPQITPDDQIIMKVMVNKDSRGEMNDGFFAINKREVETLARVENGGTLVLGGIFMEDDRNQTSKVPLLGDLPILGNLFKTTNKVHTRRELLVFITPKIMKEELTLR